MKFLKEVSGPPFVEKIPDHWIFDRIEDWARKNPDRNAFVIDHSDRVEEYKYPDVLKSAEKIAAALHGSGLCPGDRVGILMENIPQWVFVLLGVMRLGAVGVPLAAALPENALLNIVNHSGCRFIFADGPNVEKAVHVAAADNIRVVVVNGMHPAAESLESFTDKVGPVPPRPVGRDDETALIIYTSGTTGDPKGVQLTPRNLACEIIAVSEPLEISSAHRILSVLPFSHVLPLVANGIGPLCIGAGVVFLSSVSPQRIIEAFQKHRITFFICVPQFFYVLHKRIFSQIESQSALPKLAFRSMFWFSGRISNPDLKRKLFARIHRAVGPDLRLFASGGSRFDPRVAEDLNRLGYITLQAYGLTETSAAVTATPVRRNVIGTVGEPIRGVSIRIDAPNTDGVGEVCISGPILMKGYYRDEVHTREVIPDGWFHSGDLGYIRPDGNVVITGRSKDVIVLASGKNIYPEELEAHYSQTPLVKEICILGVAAGAREHGGEKLHAVIVPDMDEFRRRSQTAITAALRFEIENLSKQLPSYQHILSFSTRNEPLPRTVTRKLKRFEIQQDEVVRNETSGKASPRADHSLFAEGVGAVVAKLVREIKPEMGSLDPEMNLELDLGFDSLTRVELLGLAESRIGTRVDEKEASRIFTLGEFVDTLASARFAEPVRGRSWKEILGGAIDSEIANHEVFFKPAIRRFGGYLSIKVARLLFLLFVKLRCEGLEKLPRQLPFILCPNHQSFLDGPLLVSTLPRNVIENIFILGYTDYWKNPLMKRVSRYANIVEIDPNVNLVRAMQVGAAGLRKNRVLLIFPEGKRTIDGHVAEFKKGAAILASELGVPLVPVALRGAFEMWPRGGHFRLHPVRILIGDPIDPMQFADCADPYSALNDALRERVKQLANDTL